MCGFKYFARLRGCNDIWICSVIGASRVTFFFPLTWTLDLLPTNPSENISSSTPLRVDVCPLDRKLNGRGMDSISSSSSSSSPLSPLPSPKLSTKLFLDRDEVVVAPGRAPEHLTIPWRVPGPSSEGPFAL